MKVISIINQKGGTGKTTTAFNLASGLKNKGFKTLLIDLDPQANLTYCLTADRFNLTTYELLKGEKISPYEIENNFYLLPSSIRLSKAELELSGTFGREYLLEDYLKTIEVDYIVIDCPPSLNVLSLNALIASNLVIAPVQTEPLAIEGLDILISTLQTILKRLNKEINYLVLPTMHDHRNKISVDILNYLVENYPLTKSLIRRNVRLSELSIYKKNIFEYAPTSNGAKDYLALVEEVIRSV